MRGEHELSRLVFQISTGFMVAALLALALSLYLSDYYTEEQRRLAAAGDVEAAMDASQRATRLAPFDADPLEARSLLLQQQGRYGDAADALRQAIEREPHNYMPYLLLGNLQLSRDNLDAAIRNYRSVLELNPNSSIARTGLAKALVRKGDLEAARREYEWLLEKRQITYEGLYDLGRIYVRTGEPQKGYQAIKRARRMASRGIPELEEPLKSQREELVASMELALADALVVQRRYSAARRVISQSSSEQAPALLQLLISDPEGYRESVVNSEIY